MQNGCSTHSHITRQGSSAKDHSRFARTILPGSERNRSRSPKSKDHRHIASKLQREPSNKNPASFDAGLGGPQVNDLPNDNFSLSVLYPQKCADPKFSAQAACWQSHPCIWIALPWSFARASASLFRRRSDCRYQPACAYVCSSPQGYSSPWMVLSCRRIAHFAPPFFRRSA